MDIKRLRYAIALAEELNFARAAEKVHLSQPALSRAIQTLEEELGMPLFDRDNRNVKVTTVGAMFLEQARRLMFQMRSLERDIALVRDGEFGQVAFGAGPLPTASMISQLVTTLRSDRPGLTLTITSNNWRYLLVHLRDEEIEFFVADTRDISPDHDITITPLCRQHGPFLCRAGHPLLKKKTVKPADLRPYSFASLMLPQSFKAVLRKVLDMEPGAPLPIALECDNIQVLKQMTMSHDVVLLATEASAAEEIAAGKLIPMYLKDMPPMYAQMGIVQLAGRSLSPGAKLAVEELRNIAGTLPGTSVYRDGAYTPLKQA